MRNTRGHKGETFESPVPACALRLLVTSVNPWAEPAGSFLRNEMMSVTSSDLAIAASSSNESGNSVQSERTPCGTGTVAAMAESSIVTEKMLVFAVGALRAVSAAGESFATLRLRVLVAVRKPMV